MWTQEELETKTKEELIEIILKSQEEVENLMEAIDALDEIYDQYSFLK